MTQTGPCKVLLVEDSLAFRTALANFVRARWPMVEILEAEDLAQARRSVREQVPRLVFLDLELPDGIGLDLLPVIREAGHATTVMVCTSHQGDEMRSAALSTGIQGYLNKRQMDWEQVDRAVAAAARGV